MSTDLKVIQEIEKNIGKKLKQLPLGNILGLNNGFALGDGGRVTGLNLWRCELTDISALQTLTQLTRLRLDDNQLTDISTLQTLTQLKTLVLVFNQLTDISALQTLTQLTVLDLDDNQLTDISALQTLTQLTVLDLGNNQLTDISALQSLTQLKELFLYNNRVTDISALQSLTRLKELDLKKNKITRLPTFITQWNVDITWEEYSSGRGFHLYGNPLETPPVEVVKGGMDAVRNYFEELGRAETLLLQAKLLIVGSGEVGKTTLMRTLTERRFKLKKKDIGKEETTHGIHIKPWSVACPLEDDCEPSRELTLHTWDFGGQDIYLSTHQFFLTKRSLYIFVWEARKEEEFRSFDYWLNVIKLLSDNSPVIVVMNKADIRGKPIDEAAYMDKFKNIAAFVQVSCLTRAGIDELSGKIHECLGSMPHLKDTLPKTWLDIRDTLKAEKKDYIDAERYYEICGEFGLNYERADFLSDYLHDLGVILRFRTDPLLKSTLVLNPEWAVEAVYKLIDTPSILADKGRFDFHDLETIWDREKYPTAKHPQLIRLMERFELCFNLTGTAVYIVPELVPDRRPAVEARYERAKGMLRFRYRYDFMPKGIVSRFIARNYLLIQNDNFWQNGVELVFEDSTALVTGDSLDRELRVAVLGPRQTELLAIIRNELNHTHGTLNMKKDAGHYKEEVPCNCTACLEKTNPQLFPFKHLKNLTEKGMTLTCMQSYEYVQPGVLLRGYELPSRKATLLEEMLRVVQPFQAIADAHKDDENSRTGFIAKLLTMRNFMVHEQQPLGRSQTGKRRGLPDLVLAETDGRTASVVEAFNLTGLHSKVISEHVLKIFGYDIHGLRENFILVYVTATDFDALWNKYTEYIQTLDYHPYPLTGAMETVGTNQAEIKCAGAVHSREGEESRLYHIFINMKMSS